ncbi:ATP-binding protein, partial [Zhenhengia yiwuensis]
MKSSHKFNDTDAYIQEMLRSFKLIDIRANYEEEIQKAIKNNLSYKEFLLNLIRLEELGKKTRLVNRNIENAGFERYQTFENYDYTFHDHRYTQKLKSLETLDFMYHTQNVILIGPPGVGKSHIATALGIN